MGMSNSTPLQGAPGPTATTATTQGRPGRGWVIAMRTIISLHLATVLLQAFTAGGLLDGVAGQGALHGTGSAAVHLAGLIQLIVAVLYWRPGRGVLWPVFASLLLLVAGGVQSAMGGSGILAVHVPLALVLFGGVGAMLAWSLRVGSPKSS